MASPLDATECADCGKSFERPERVRHETEASTAEVMRITSDPALVGEWLVISDVGYAAHRKPGKLPTLRVSYQCGMRLVNEWVCLEHESGSFPRRKAERWWRERFGIGPIPAIVGDAIPLTATLRAPHRILVKPKDKYLEILSYDFNRPEAEESLAG